MGSRFTRLRRRFALLAALALVAGTIGVVGMLPAVLAGAQEDEEPEVTDPEEICFRLVDGSLTIGAAPPIPIPPAGTGFCGTLDPETGDFAGDLTIGSLVDFPFGGFELDIRFAASNFNAQFSVPADGEAELTPAPGDVNMSFDLVVTIEVADFSCSLPSTSLAPSTEKPGGSPFDPASHISAWMFTVADGGFGVGGVPVSPSCPVADLVNEGLGAPTSNTSVAMTFEAGDIPAPADPPPAEVEAEVEAEADTDVLAAEAAEATEADELPFTGVDRAVLLIAAAMALGVGFVLVSASRLVPARADRRR